MPEVAHSEERPGTVSDYELLSRWVGAKDEAAFAELVRRHGGLVYGACRRIVRDHHAAEEVAQDCLVEFSRKADSVRSSVSGFLYAMATTRARNRVRGDARRGRHEAAVHADAPEDVDGSDAQWREMSPFLDQALADLPEEERLALLLHFFEGRPQTEVAEELGCGRTAVARRIARGLEGLREHLRRAGVVASVAGLSATLEANAAEAAPPALHGAAATIAAKAKAAAAGAPATSALALKLGLVLAVLLTSGIVALSLRRAPVAPSASAAIAEPAMAAKRWPRGLPSDPAFFPIGVWLQDPAHAAAYRAAGITLFYHLWDGPSEADLAALSAAGMKLFCAQNDVALRHLDDPTIVGWFTAGAPDCEGLTDGMGGIRTPAGPADVIRDHGAAHARDGTRPTGILLGPGVAWDAHPSRGGRVNHPEDYEGYCAGAEVLAFQAHPVNESEQPLSGRLEYVALGVDRLRAWSGGTKPVWPMIECTRMRDESPGSPTPAQVRSEIWMALIHGATGLVYYCHSFSGGREDGARLLHDPPMLAAVTDLNRQVAMLAPVLNSETVADGATVGSSNGSVPIDVMVKHWGGATYVFAVAMRDGATTATFTLPATGAVEVIGEDRTLVNEGGRFSDAFAGYAAHLYRIPEPPAQR